MQTSSSTVLSVLSGRRQARKILHRLFWLVVTSFLVGPTLHSFRSVPIYRNPREPKLSANPPTPVNEAASAHSGYDCSGDLRVPSAEGERYVDEAIDEALRILKTCDQCRQMFGSANPNYAAELLKRMRRNKAIIISAAVPTDWSLSPDRKKLTVKRRVDFKEAAGMTLDLLRSKQGEMKAPCIYVNVAGFIVTGRPAEYFALYGLDPPIQRAVAILHELGHVANVLQNDGGKTKELRRKSVANTNCVRRNCITCKAFQPCRSTPEPLKKRRKT